MHTGIANLPLHGGRAPAWLFQRMRRLAREITRLIVEEEGPEALLRRLADPFWFQALGCLLGFDWHSSGVTTTTCGALQEGLRGLERELGLFAAGGKGGRSRRTPRQSLDCGAALDPAVDAGELVEASRLAAKVDSAAIQDGYPPHHHSFFFTRGGRWTVCRPAGSMPAARSPMAPEGIVPVVGWFFCTLPPPPDALKAPPRDSGPWARA